MKPLTEAVRLDTACHLTSFSRLTFQTGRKWKKKRWQVSCVMWHYGLLCDTVAQLGVKLLGLVLGRKTRHGLGGLSHSDCYVTPTCFSSRLMAKNSMENLMFSMKWHETKWLKTAVCCTCTICGGLAGRHCCHRKQPSRCSHCFNLDDTYTGCVMDWCRWDKLFCLQS